MSYFFIAFTLGFIKDLLYDLLSECLLDICPSILCNIFLKRIQPSAVDW